MKTLTFVDADANATANADTEGSTIALCECCSGKLKRNYYRAQTCVHRNWIHLVFDSFEKQTYSLSYDPISLQKAAISGDGEGGMYQVAEFILITTCLTLTLDYSNIKSTMTRQ